MEKKTTIALVVGLGALGAYLIYKKPKVTTTITTKVNASGTTTEDLSEQINAKATEQKIQPTLPRFGVPVNLIKKRNFVPSKYTNFTKGKGYKKYVDVKNNAFFQPKLGVFHK